MADLDMLVSTLRSRHPGLYTKNSPEEWARVIAAIREGVPTRSDAENALEFARLAALAGDGHTSVNARALPLFTSFPFRAQWFDEGWVLVGVPSDQPSAYGTVIQTLDNMPIAEVLDRLRPYISYENEWWFRNQAVNYLNSPEVLHYLGITANRSSVTINGELTFAAPSTGMTVGPILSEPRFPLWARNAGVFYWFHYLPESRTIYMKYNVCQAMTLLPPARFRADLAAAFAANPVERFILDVRNNGGGNSEVIEALLPPVPGEVKKAVIIGRQTFSSGMLNAARLATRGYTMVGEPTGGKPTSFGEVLPVVLPYSGLRGQYSTRLFRGLIQPENDSVLPDVVVPWTWDAYSRERDPFLETALTLN